MSHREPIELIIIGFFGMSDMGANFILPIPKCMGGMCFKLCWCTIADKGVDAISFVDSMID